MAPFKGCFLGAEPPPARRVTTSQRCMRTGGKHNDLDNVGHTRRHHTFFEMLGNFSFGDYFKRDAIAYAWEFLTRELQLDPSRLSVTVHHTDEEAAALWREITGLPDAKIGRLGDEDNFWSMGHGEGPCGPCTEIFYDRGPDAVDNDDERFLEIWNLVFMQYRRTADGKLVSLVSPCVDTGMGLERLASVMQRVGSNFEIDTFDTLARAVRELMPKQQSVEQRDTVVAIRVIIDHVRAAAFLISDGVVPSHADGRGQVLRNIVRRALRYGTKLGFYEPFLHRLVPSVAMVMGSAYPQLVARQREVAAVLAQEEAAIFRTLQHGLRALEKSLLRLSKAASSASPTSTKVLPADVVADLFINYGFTADFTAQVAREHGWAVDIDVAIDRIRHIERERSEQQRTTSLNADLKIPPQVLAWKAAGVATEFTGYRTLEESTARVVAVAPPATAGEPLWISIQPCPFYARGGGQVGDRGVLIDSDSGHVFRVVDTVSPYDGAVALRVVDTAETDDRLVPGKTVTARVDMRRRIGARVHHTATHLLQSALQRVVAGDSANPTASVRQAGSVVDVDRLKFDFTCPMPKLGNERIRAVEEYVAAAIAADIPLVTMEMPREQAMQSGAIALFGERYPEVVRVVDVAGISQELCGGTHVSRTSEVRLFHIVSESSAGAGVRSIEAVAGDAAERWVSTQINSLWHLAEALGVDVDSLLVSKAVGPQFEDKIRKMVDSVRRLEAEKLKADLARAETEMRTVVLSAVEVQCGSVPYVVHIVQSEEDEREEVLRKRVDVACALRPGVVHVVVACRSVACGYNKTSKNLADVHCAKLLSTLLAEDMPVSTAGRAHTGTKLFATRHGLGQDQLERLRALRVCD